jgi:RNA polymerase sigma factor (sigma-70 family)
MANRRLPSALGALRDLFAGGTTTGLSDGQLLGRFAAGRRESAESAAAADLAFAALVDRHGAMVWGVCRRVLGDAHEAEDAFQATFLVLARRAGSVRVDDSLGRWLYGVALRVARRARSEADRREARPGVPRAPSAADPAADAERRELAEALSEEVDRLPSKYRCAIELCYFQGLTYAQAARRLDWPAATVKSRLARGRLRLRRGMARRGLAPGVLAAVAAEARAAVPPAVVKSTLRAASSHAVAAVPSTIASLSEGVLKMMTWEKIGAFTAGAIVALGLTAAGMSQLPADAPPPAIAGQGGRPASKPDAPDPRWTKSLPNGATIEVVGVSTHPSGPGTWWRPDGTPLDRPPCDPSRTNLMSDQPSDVARAIVVRISGLAAGAEHHWRPGHMGSNSMGRATRDGKPIDDLSLAVGVFPGDVKSCSISFEAAAGPWKTVKEWGKSPGSTGSRNGPSFIVSDPIATAKGTVLAVTHSIEDRSTRIVALDRDGKEHTSEFLSGGGVWNYSQLVVEFGLPPDQIKGFRVQTREYEKLEIPGVALRPADRP